MVDTRLFTGSHDGTVKVWDIAGIKDETDAVKAEGDEEIDDETKIIIDDTYPYGENGYNETGSMFLIDDEANPKSKRDELMDMV